MSEDQWVEKSQSAGLLQLDCIVFCRDFPLSLHRPNLQVLAVDSLPSGLSTIIGEDLLGLFALAEVAVSNPGLPSASSPAVAGCLSFEVAVGPAGRVGAVNEPVSVSSAPIASSVVSALLSSEASRDLLESPAVQGVQ